MMNRLVKPKTDKSRGAAAVIVGASLVALLGATGLAVDIGNLQATRNRTATAADSAALAAAQELSDSETEATACATAQTHVTANEPGATMTSCSTSIATNGQAVVTVELQQVVDYVFGGAVGFDSATVNQRTTARYGPQGVSGLRPFGLCMETLSSLLGSWDPSGLSSVGPVMFPFDGSTPADCNGGVGVPGNWGNLDFDGGSNGTPDQIDWITNGYDGVVHPGDVVEGNPGSLGGALSGALGSLVSSGEVFQVPIFGSVSGSGANATFDVIGFVTAQLTGYAVTGNPSNRHLEFVFSPGQWPGVQCCDINGPSLVLAASGICAYNNETDAC